MAKIHVGKVAAAIHNDMCDDNSNGYSQCPRWGEDGKGIKTITIDGLKYSYDRGSYDCASSVIRAWRVALTHTAYAGALDEATYTGDARSVFVHSGLFSWKSPKFEASAGDLYLDEENHVAMCQSQYPDLLSEFSLNEKGGIVGGKVGDQTGREAWVHDYYNGHWDGILHYNGKADFDSSTPGGGSSGGGQSPKAPKQPQYRVYQGGKWSTWHEGGSVAGDKHTDIYDFDARDLGNGGWFQLTLRNGTVLPRNKRNNAHKSAIMGITIYYATSNPKATGYYEARYRVFNGSRWLKWEVDDNDGGAGDDKHAIRAVQLKIVKCK